jgi:hypothetical protein
MKVAKTLGGHLTPQLIPWGRASVVLINPMTTAKRNTAKVRFSLRIRATR